MTPPEPNPTVARRRLAVRFRALREEAGHSLRDLAAHLRVPEPQASRLDTGARGFNPDQIRRLADWYGLAASEVPELLALGAESRKRGWWQQVDLADSYRTLIGLEQAAKSINEFSGMVVPGLLQTPAYARAVARGDSIDVEPPQIEQAVEVRMRRQRILAADDAPRLRIVIDEAVLARVTGGPSVMAEQLAHMERMSMRPNITVQVIGFEAGSHLGMTKNQFILVELGDGFPDVLYTESIHGPEDTVKIGDYWRAWNELRAAALDRATTRSRLRKYRDELTRAV